MSATSRRCWRRSASATARCANRRPARRHVFTAATAMSSPIRRRRRAAYRLIPDGTYEFWDYLDDELLSPIPVRIRAALTVKDGLLHLDFTGTIRRLPQLSTCRLLERDTPGCRCGSHNTPFPRPYGAAEFWYLHPLTATTRPVRCSTRAFPLPSAAARHWQPHHRVGERAARQGCARLHASRSGGIIIPVVFAEPEDETPAQRDCGGTDDRRHRCTIGRRWCGWGETSTGKWQQSAGDCGNISSITVLHSAAAIRGRGCWRGGVGLELTFAPRRFGTQVLGRGIYRIRFQPWGLAGGLAGAAARPSSIADDRMNGSLAV